MEGLAPKEGREPPASGSTPSPTVAEVLNAAEVDKRCGNCGLWGANFYPRRPNFPVNDTCAADVVMDLPASFIPGRQTMRRDQGEGCIAWRPLGYAEDAALRAAASKQVGGGE